MWICFILFVFNLSYADEGSIRTVKLKVAADEEFRNQIDWQLKTKRLIANSSEINPEFYGPHNNLGSVYLNQNKIEEAVKEYKTALEIKADYPEARYNLGRAYFLKGMLREAENEFLKAVQLRPEYDKALCALAAVHIQFGLGDLAVQECRSALKINPKNLIARYTLAHALYKQGIPQQAEKECRQAIALGLEVPQSYNLLGIILEQRRKRGEAKNQFLKAIELAPKFIEGHLNLANIYFKSKNFSKSDLFKQMEKKGCLCELHFKELGVYCHYHSA